MRGLLDKDYAGARRALIGETALLPAPGEPARGGTVYLCAADGEGMMVSYIQSNFQGFGSGVVVPGRESPSRTGGTASLWSPAIPTAWPPASGRSTPSSRPS